jgi:multicomponent Na+:H+ antiporter subunit A
VIAARSPIVRQGVLAAGPLAVVVAVYLLFAGHNRPGGGFAAGLVIGAVIALRTAAALPRPRRAVPLLAAGGVLAGLVALAPLVVGHVVLDQVVVEWTVPILGTVKSGSALLFDVGVALIVVGLVVAVLGGLGAEELSRPAKPVGDRSEP